MSGPFGSSQWMYNAGSDYEIDNSLRFDNGATEKLTFTPGSAGNTKLQTVSVWVKRGTLGSVQGILSAGGRFDTAIGFTSTDKMNCFANYAENYRGIETAGVFRDCSAWYHIVANYDTNNATSTDRFILYVNGVRQAVSAETTIPKNVDTKLFSATEHTVGTGGRYQQNTRFDGLMAEMHAIDGQVLAPTAFGEYGDYGEWKPIDCKDDLTYGTNGFYLDFKSSAVGTASSTTIGADRSGNDHHYTSSNIAVTDQMIDSPTNNFCTLNPANSSYNNFTGAEGNLKGTGTSSSAAGNSYGTQSHQKGYFEWLVVSDNENSRVGIKDADDIVSVEYSGAGNAHTSGGPCYVLEADDGTIRKREGGSNATIATYTALDVDDIGICAFDIPNQKIWFGRNGTWFNSGDPANGNGSVYASIDANLTFIPVFNGDTSGDAILNFGQDSTFAGEDTGGAAAADSKGFGDFYYAPPSGFLALCTNNLPEPTVIPSEHFNTVLYTGDGSVQDITTVGFLPDFTWIKNRDTTDFHQLFDSLRGPTELLMSDSGTLEATDDDTLTAFLSNGFTTGDDLETNTNGEAYVAWNWKAGGNAAAVGSNTDGSINTTDTSANVDAGFSIITYTGNGTAGATIGHGLSKVPEMFIVRQRDQASSWWTFHKDLDATAPEDKSIRLNLDSSLSDDATIWNDTAPTSTLISLGSYADVNRDAGLFLCYAFHSVDGYCKVGSYTGNGNADGSFIYTGFRPRFILNKALYGSTSWVMTDTSRSTFNQTIGALLADNRGAEETYTYFDIVSNGFKARNTSTWVNGNDVTIIYIAFAETPFKYSNAR